MWRHSFRCDAFFPAIRRKSQEIAAIAKDFMSIGSVGNGYFAPPGETPITG